MDTKKKIRNNRSIKMAKVKKKAITTKKALTKKPKRKNIVGNFRGKEDIVMKKVRDGMIKFLSSAFPKK